MFKKKSAEQYWKQFTSYQTFETVSDLNMAIKQFESTYDLTDAIKAVLNTIKLHSKTIFGVCWLKKERIAEKAKVSMSTVDRAIKGLKETGFLTVIPFGHTKFGRRTHNIYVLNPIFEVAEEVANEVTLDDQNELSNPCPASDSASEPVAYKNPHKNSNKTLKDLSITLDTTSVPNFDILKPVPNEFIDLLEPFYGHSPEIIRDRWKTVCSAVKKSCNSFEFASWESIRQAWKDTVKMLKRGRIRTATDDGIGGYFYGVLCDYLMDDYLRNTFA